MIIDIQDSLTNPQRHVLSLFRQRAEAGLEPPTLRELCVEFGWKSTATARDHLKALTRKGMIKPALKKSRGARLTSPPFPARAIPVIGRIVAGQPVLAEENIQGEVVVPYHLLSRGCTFALRVTGDSMQNAGIMEGDIVLVRDTQSPRSGQIVAATVNGETTLKRLQRRDNRWVLVPENPKYTPIPIHDERAKIHGVVVALMRDYDGLLL